MGRALAFDYGERRTGLAETDDLQIIATPLEGVDTSTLWDTLTRLMASGKYSDFVVGDPSMFGGVAHSDQAIQHFVEDLSKRYPGIPIHRVDESYSSREAMTAMVQGGMRKGQRRDKKTLDMVSAAIILQRWLERR
jgi:putative Holliday junction resolvase